MWTKAFWKDAAERAVKTFAQALIVAWPISGWVQSAGDFAWSSAGAQFAAMAITAAGAGLLSIVMSLAGAYVDEQGTPQVGVSTYNYEG